MPTIPKPTERSSHDRVATIAAGAAAAMLGTAAVGLASRALIASRTRRTRMRGVPVPALQTRT